MQLFKLDYFVWMTRIILTMVGDGPCFLCLLTSYYNQRQYGYSLQPTRQSLAAVLAWDPTPPKPPISNFAPLPRIDFLKTWIARCHVIYRSTSSTVANRSLPPDVLTPRGQLVHA